MSTRRQKKNRKNRRNQRRSSTRKGNTRRNGPSGMKGAPVAISDDMQQYTYFTQHNRGIQMHTCAAIFQIASTGVTALGGASLQGLGGVNRVAAQLNLTAPQGLTFNGVVNDMEYISPVWDLIASAFVRYRVKSCSFHYEPQSTSVANGRLVFAFAQDPLHPVLWQAVLTQGDILSVADSIAFMPWKAWSMDVSDHLDDTLYYTFSDPGTTLLGFTERFSDWGVISCITDAEDAAEILGGVLYMETCIQLEEFCPISVVRPTMARRLVKRLVKHAIVENRTPVRRDTKDKSLNDFTIISDSSATCKNTSVISQPTRITEKGAVVINY